jgi:hypothetical protein
MIRQRDKSIFENLFVLELANNHLGGVERGLKIIRDHAIVVRYNNVRAAIEPQSHNLRAQVVALLARARANPIFTRFFNSLSTLRGGGG